MPATGDRCHIIDYRLGQADYGLAIKGLPPMQWDAVDARCKAGEMLVVVEGIVHKVDEFLSDYPGCAKILQF
jgi:hypothetical protein